MRGKVWVLSFPVKLRKAQFKPAKRTSQGNVGKAKLIAMAPF
jgi:hypothetical protein